MAQRAGWERTGSAPMWHQLEWAGWVTSYTRAMLYEVLSKIPWEHLIAVETDGIYTTMNPAELGISDSKQLGGWEVTKYQELIYLQSGVYAYKQDGKWGSKYRGLDKDSLSTEDIVKHAQLLRPNEDWPPLKGRTTRFVGYRAALFREDQNRGPMKVHHAVWETDDKEISCGMVGKRRHIPKLCDACRAGKTAYDMPHDLTVNSRSLLVSHSYRHDIPWIDDFMPDWREMADEVGDLLK